MAKCSRRVTYCFSVHKIGEEDNVILCNTDVEIQTKRLEYSGRKTLKNTLIDEFYFIEKKSLVAVIIPPVCTL